ncbi:MAG: acyltransferase [Saprospiraceae bacterium]|nr:acyltransferase [Saprospiraceae bacterium]MBK9630830.1 acyltransferase [Saprospiraceae bacterium]
MDPRRNPKSNILKIKVKNAYSWVHFLFIKFRIFLFGKEMIARSIHHAFKWQLPYLINAFNGKCGKDVNFKGHITVDNVYEDVDSTGDLSRLQIGHQCVIGTGAFFDLTDQIILEDQVGIGANSMLMTHMDLGRMPMSKIYPRKKDPIVISKGTFLGAHVIVLQGVRLGESCVVAAGSVVTENFPAYSLIAGVPAKLVKTLTKPLE